MLKAAVAAGHDVDQMSNPDLDRSELAYLPAR
jgi:hypothetical protein